ncbi:putative reverse transcriptase domain-containing protein [Tanacetum coccineum]
MSGLCCIAPAGGKIYAGNLPKCNRCNLHHHGPCPQKCQRCQRFGHMEKDCRVRPQGAANDGAVGRGYVWLNIHSRIRMWVDGRSVRVTPVQEIEFSIYLDFQGHRQELTVDYKERYPLPDMMTCWTNYKGGAVHRNDLRSGYNQLALPDGLDDLGLCEASNKVWCADDERAWVIAYA